MKTFLSGMFTIFLLSSCATQPAKSTKPTKVASAKEAAEVVVEKRKKKVCKSRRTGSRLRSC